MAMFTDYRNVGFFDKPGVGDALTALGMGLMGMAVTPSNQRGQLLGPTIMGASQALSAGKDRAISQQFLGLKMEEERRKLQQQAAQDQFGNMYRAAQEGGYEGMPEAGAPTQPMLQSQFMKAYPTQGASVFAESMKPETFGAPFETETGFAQMGNRGTPRTAVGIMPPKKERPVLPGRDVPYPPEVARQLTDIAGAKAAAMRPGIEEVTATERAKEGVKAEIKKEVAQPAALSAFKDLERQSDTVISHIDKAIDIAAPRSATGERVTNPWATGYGTFLQNLPNTEAGTLKNELDTIRANVGFDKLQQMRNNSPTGGALGQVSEMENRLLQAVNGALDPKQADQLVQNLIAIREIYPKVLEERKRAYEQDYGPMSTETPKPSGGWSAKRVD